MKLDRTTLAVAAATIGLGLIGAVSASAQGHTLSKVGSYLSHTNKKATHAIDKAGHATEYSTRKGVAHASVGTHRALGHNSVVIDRKRHRKYIERPDGTRKMLRKHAK